MAGVAPAVGHNMAEWAEPGRLRKPVKRAGPSRTLGGCWNLPAAVTVLPFTTFRRHSHIRVHNRRRHTRLAFADPIAGCHTNGPS